MECKMHIDVFVEVQIRVCLSWEYQENQHGWQPSPEGTDSSPVTCSSANVWESLKKPRMNVWQRSMDTAKSSSCLPDVMKFIKSG